MSRQSTITHLTQHIQVDDRQLYFEYIDHAEHTGPTIVFEAGGGNGCSTWNQVFPDVASFGRVFRYDRAGLGQSEPTSQARTLHNICEDLRAILVKAAIPQPYLLVGHSIGGLSVCLYAYRYPAEVSGLVLLDSSHPDQQVKLGPLVPSETPDESETMPIIRKELLAPEVEFGGERINFAASFAQARSITSLGDLRLVVLSAGRSSLVNTPGVPADFVKQLEQGWQELQRDLLNLSSRSKQIVAEESGHYIHLDQPQLVIGAIRTAVEQVRGS